jgi:hypothetical protein
MVVAVVTPVVFCAKATENAIKRCFKTMLYTLLTIHCNKYYNSRNTNSSRSPSCSVARARTTFVQLNPGILGIAGRLLSLQE